MIQNLLITLLCYSLSIAGITFSFILPSMLFDASHKNIFYSMPLFIVSIAWIFHFAMCLQWIFQKPINKFLIKVGTFFGIASFCMYFIPLLLVSFSSYESMLDSIKIIGLETLLVLPCLCLIIDITKQS